MHEDLQIIVWPDPRLRKVSQPVETFDDNLKALTAGERPCDLLRAG